MMQFEKYTEYAVEQAKKLLAIDSPDVYKRQHMKKHCVLADIPAVGSEHILRTLV